MNSRSRPRSISPAQRSFRPYDAFLRRWALASAPPPSAGHENTEKGRPAPPPLGAGRGERASRKGPPRAKPPPIDRLFSQILVWTTGYERGLCPPLFGRATAPCAVTSPSPTDSAIGSRSLSCYLSSPSAPVLPSNSVRRRAMRKLTGRALPPPLLSALVFLRPAAHKWLLTQRARGCRRRANPGCTAGNMLVPLMLPDHRRCHLGRVNLST